MQGFTDEAVALFRARLRRAEQVAEDQGCSLLVVVLGMCAMHYPAGHERGDALEAIFEEQAEAECHEQPDAALQAEAEAHGMTGIDADEITEAIVQCISREIEVKS